VGGLCAESDALFRIRASSSSPLRRAVAKGIATLLVEGVIAQTRYTQGLTSVRSQVVSYVAGGTLSRGMTQSSIFANLHHRSFARRLFRGI
jgi:hypothetical protein